MARTYRGREGGGDVREGSQDASFCKGGMGGYGVCSSGKIQFEKTWIALDYISLIFIEPEEK